MFPPTPVQPLESHRRRRLEAAVTNSLVLDKSLFRSSFPMLFPRLPEGACSSLSTMSTGPTVTATDSGSLNSSESRVDKEPALRLTCQPSTLGQALQTVSRAISTRTTLPILNNILLEPTSEGLSLTATNLEIGIRKVVSAEVAEEGSTTAPARLLTDFVGSLPDESLEMALDVGTQTLGVRCG